MSDSDRQLYFADHVIELQAAEDEKRRRIRDARRRAEKAQRDAYREVIRIMAIEGAIIPSTRWRNVEDVITADPTFLPVQEQDHEAPREIFEDFVEDWNVLYRRDRSFLSHLVQSFSKKGTHVTPDTGYEVFTKKLLEAAAYSPEVYADTRRVINREEPVSSARLHFNELVLRAKEDADEAAKSFRSKTGFKGQLRRGSTEDSSEDEGEIVEDGEVEEDEAEDIDTEVKEKPVKEEEEKPIKEEESS
jgi:pre-mRNA-processing factor 40